MIIIHIKDTFYLVGQLWWLFIDHVLELQLCFPRIPSSLCVILGLGWTQEEDLWDLEGRSEVAGLCKCKMSLTGHILLQLPLVLHCWALLLAQAGKTQLLPHLLGTVAWPIPPQIRASCPLFASWNPVWVSQDAPGECPGSLQVLCTIRELVGAWWKIS